MRQPVRIGVASAAAAIAVGCMALVATNENNPVQDVRLLSGSAWLTSGNVGQVSLLDGSSAELAAKVQAASNSSVLEVAQAGANAYVVDQSAGTVQRLDGATFEISKPVEPIAGAKAGLTAFAGAGKLYIVDTRRGLFTNADPRTGQPLNEPSNLAAQIAPNTTGIDSDGQLWIADNATGDLRVVIDGEAKPPIQGVTQPGRSILTMANGKPVIVDTIGRQALVVNPAAKQVAATMGIDVRPGEDIQVSGSPYDDRVYVVAARGVLSICDLKAGNCAKTVPLANGKLGAAVEAGKRLFVPDYDTGQVWIVDLDKHAVVAQPQVLKTGKQFQLFNRDGVVFFNDQESNQAGVIRIDGTVQDVAKYDANDPKKGLDAPIVGVPQPPNTTASQPPTQQPTAPPVQPTVAVPNPTQQPTQPPVNNQPTQPPVNNQPTQPQDQTQNPPAPTPPTQNSPNPPAPSDPPTLSITLSKNSPVMNTDVTLQAAGNKGAAPPTSEWDFGDGTPKTHGAAVPHRWTAAGSYLVTVKATIEGKETIGSRTIEVTKPPTTKVPTVLGMTQANATAALTNADLQTDVKQVPSNRVAKGLVVAQSPQGEAAVARQSVVTIQVSSGKPAAIDLYAEAKNITWRGNSGPLKWNDDGVNGFAMYRVNWPAENGTNVTALETHPEGAPTGNHIEGTFTLARPIIADDHFRATIGFGEASPGEGAGTFVVSVVKADGKTAEVYRKRDTQKDGNMPVVDVDLTPYAGATKITLRVNMDEQANQDWAIWVRPRIEG